MWSQQPAVACGLSLRGVAALRDPPEEVVTLLLLVHEDEDLALFVELPEDLQQSEEALILRPQLHVLRDVAVHHAAASHLC